MKCPKCSYERKSIDQAPDYECPSCGIVYKKYRSPTAIENTSDSIKKNSSTQNAKKIKKLIECDVCGKQLSSGAATCPHCGENNLNVKSQSSILGIISVGLGISSVLMPYFAAVFLVPITIICAVIAINSNHRRLGKIAIILGLIGLAGVMYTSNKIKDITNGTEGKPTETPLSQPIEKKSPIVTRSKYDQIQEGFTYSDIQSIIGTNGEEISRSDIGGISTVMYSWTNSNGSNMNAMLQNDRLITKAQFGLP